MIYAESIIIITLLAVSDTTNSYNQHLLPEVHNAIEWNCIKDIVEHLRHKETSLYYSTFIEMVDDIAKLLTTNGSYMRNLDVFGDKSEPDEMSEFHVLITDKAEHAKKYFNHLYRTYGFRSDTDYFIIYLGEDGLKVILENANIGFLQTVVIMDRLNNLHTLESYKINCGRNMQSKVMTNCNALNLTIIESIYGRKHKQFYGCDVRVLPVMLPPYIVDVNSSDPGIEPELFHIAAAKYNFSVVYMDPKNLSWGQRFADGSYIRMAERLYNREGDVMFGGFRTNATFLIDFQAGLPYFTSSIAFYVPAGKSENDWRAMVRVYKKYIWIGIACSLIVISITFYLISKMIREIYGKKIAQYSFLETIGILLGKAIHQPKSIPLRIIFITFTIFSFMFTSSYENTLLTFLILPSKGKQINSVKEIFLSGMKFGGIRFAKDILGYLSSPVFNGWFDCQLSSLCINMTAFDRDIAMVDDTKAVGYYLNTVYNETSRKLLHKLPDLYTYYIWMTFNKGFPVLNFVDNVIGRCRDSGLITRLVHKYAPRPKPPPKTPHKPITLIQHHLTFCLLLGGTGLAFIIFLIEVNYKNLKKIYRIARKKFCR